MVGYAAAASAADAEAAVRAAEQAWPAWAATPAAGFRDTEILPAQAGTLRLYRLTP